ncbi:MAG: anhydro-N-acetylmuramic acid kinase [Candidatus Binatia bacterium]|nr:MAG: anhydro-N-acetylmuramic acid kinase [Candidatus Binatia bacterium]
MSRAKTVALGVMSGTSADGITAALVELRRRRNGYRATLLASRTDPYPGTVRRTLLEAAEGKSIPASRWSELHTRLGIEFAKTAGRLLRATGREVDVVGSHGHTVFHGPPGSGLSRPPSTWQIGEPTFLAFLTGAWTVADFRVADLVAGGQGAPLAPYAHALLFRHARRTRAIQNLGGIANVTVLPPASATAPVLAFDTGPGNMVVDALVRRFSRGRKRFDRGGRMAARGRVCEELLEEFLDDAYFRKRPPKSTGRERFGRAFVEKFLRRARAARLGPEDTVATATALTARSIALAYRRFVLPAAELEAVYLCGGGSYNGTLVRMLEAELRGIPVRRTDALGIPADAVEAVAFAVLACETLAGRPGNLPSVTGARQPVLLGKLVPPPSPRRR